MQKVKDSLQIFMKIHEDEKEDANKSKIGFLKTVAELEANLVKAESDAIENELDDNDEELYQ